MQDSWGWLLKRGLIWAVLFDNQWNSNIPYRWGF